VVTGELRHHADWTAIDSSRPSNLDDLVSMLAGITTTGRRTVDAVQRTIGSAASSELASGELSVFVCSE
jgi:hypothetical protein